MKFLHYNLMCKFYQLREEENKNHILSEKKEKKNGNKTLVTFSFAELLLEPGNPESF